MSDISPRTRPDLTESGITIPSDSENYDANNEESSSPPSSSSSPLILYKPPTVWGLLRGAAINLLLPFINGLMLGFGELFANELAFRIGWTNTKVCNLILPKLHGFRNSYDPVQSNMEQVFPAWRSGTRRAGPGVEVRQNAVGRRRENGEELDMYTSLE